MLYRVEYEESVQYEEVYEADTKEEAYKQFYTALKEGEVDPSDVIFHDLLVDEFV